MLYHEEVFIIFQGVNNGRDKDLIFQTLFQNFNPEDRLMHHIFWLYAQNS